MTSPRAGAPVLSLENITCRFDTVTALDGASLSVRPGTVHALLGGNGAGKTTLMRVAFGLQKPHHGTIRVHGQAHTITSPAAALALGIGMVHQHFTLVPAMTVAENVALGGKGAFRKHEAAQRVTEVAARAGLALDPHATVSSLSIGAQQRCEIIKALARNVQLLILDEPTAVLAPQEATELLRWIRHFADTGGAVVLITHKLRDAMSVADDITVLRNGQLVLQTAAKDVTEQTLMQAMVGKRSAFGDSDAVAAVVGASAQRAQASARTGAHTHDVDVGAARVTDAVLTLSHVGFTDSHDVMRVRDVSLSVRGGEIVGIAAVEGAGHQELLRILAGRLEPTHGTVTRPERIGYIPEDRHRDALMSRAPLDENIALKGAGARTGRMPWRAIRASTAALLRERDIVAGGVQSAARMLSGGNQQKLVLARELADVPQALVAVNPSRGLDFQATNAVHVAIKEARDAGTAVVVYSSDLDEVLALADRVYAMFNGELIATALDRDAVGNAILGIS